MAFRFGVAGAGRMGRNHITALRNSSVAKVVAVADPSQAALQALDGAGVSTFLDLDSMLDSAAIDGLIVCVPTTAHLATLRKVIDARLPTLAEKPLGLTVSEAHTIASLAAESAVPLQVGFWRRFVPMLVKLRHGIFQDAFGGIYSICCFQWDGAPPSANFRRNSGGILVDMGVHDFEQVRWLTGQEFASVDAVSSAVRTDEGWPDDPESVLIMARLSGGTTSVISLGRRFPLGDVCKVEVFGTNGSQECRFLWPPAVDETFANALLAQAESFVRHVGGAELVGASGSDAVAALTAAEAARQSLGPAVTRI